MERCGAVQSGVVSANEKTRDRLGSVGHLDWEKTKPDESVRRRLEQSIALQPNQSEGSRPIFRSAPKRLCLLEKRSVSIQMG
jgi:hypothetical protein